MLYNGFYPVGAAKVALNEYLAFSLTMNLIQYGMKLQRVLDGCYQMPLNNI